MKNQQPIFFTSDWHIGCENVIRFDKRPFFNTDEMSQTLIKRYNATVPKNGICYFLGDMGNKTKELTEVIQQLNGTKVCLVGNHDKSPMTLYNAGFDVVLYSATIYIAGFRVTMSHCPKRGVKREDCSHIKGSENANWHGEGRIKHEKSTVSDEGQYHLSGHIHSGPHKKHSKTFDGLQIDVGVSAHKFTPVSYSKIEAYILKHSKNKVTVTIKTF